MNLTNSVIQANCRARFTAADFDFIVHTLSEDSPRAQVSLTRLLADEEERDQILDHELLVHTILSNTEQLAISPQFYFYILSRYAFTHAGIEDRQLCDYVASLLEQFSHIARLRAPTLEDPTAKFTYLVDLLLALQHATSDQAFLLRTHIGNYSLFLTGIFPENVECRSRHRGAPDCSYYEELGRANYRVVAQHAVAKRCELTEIYTHLAEQFREIRLSLNHLANHLLNLDEPR